jgi:hypothetical protein
MSIEAEMANKKVQKRFAFHVDPQLYERFEKICAEAAMGEPQAVATALKAWLEKHENGATAVSQIGVHEAGHAVVTVAVQLAPGLKKRVEAERAGREKKQLSPTSLAAIGVEAIGEWIRGYRPNEPWPDPPPRPQKPAEPKPPQEK